MLIRLNGGKVYDPANNINGEVRDIFIFDGKIIGTPLEDTRIDKTYDIRDRIVMAGAIDIHTHIGGGKINIARMMMPEDHEADPVSRTKLTRAGCGHAAPSTLTTGYRYALLGYTACFEPAMLPINARQAHLEMGDTPIVDKGAYALLGNDDFLLRLLAENKEQQSINDYVAWIIDVTQSMAIKVVNPGGISAFKFNQRNLDLDEPHPYYRTTPRQVLQRLARATYELGVPHPLHVHGCNLGVPGNVNTTLNTINGMEGLPIHLTHIQFHSYDTEGDRKFSSAAPRIAEAVNRSSSVSIDVGQVMFGQTVTASGDTMSQYRNYPLASPKKWVCMDIECEAGCGVVPFHYRERNFVNALQWAIGLEIFLLVGDPWRVFLTTDHPNGAPFTTYPHLIRLLMDRSFRHDMLSHIHKDAAAISHLGSIDREYSLYEIAIMTRAGPAHSLGLKDRGHLAPGAAADITVYKEDANKEKMFAKPEYVFKDGELVVHKGKIVMVPQGATHCVKPDYDKGIERPLKQYFDRYHTVAFENFKLDPEEILEIGGGHLSIQPCHTGG
ncbi:MAG: formylmethanofuran dehydrogenase subunit A [Gammaproteobacteria bacterium]|nr:formylmethanofuran dehydrogenase subunit A [Gammaproteobacteria bacterium]